MSNTQKYTLRKSSNQRNVKIQIEQDIFPIDSGELVKDRVEKITQNNINPIDDWEKTKYTLKCEEGQNVPESNANEKIGCYTMSFHFFNEDPAVGGTTTDWVEAGIFNQNDIAYKSARFIGSFIRISYFTTPHRETQKLVSYANIQLDDNITTYINLCPDRPGSFIYHWKSEEKLNITNSRLYMKVEFFNSATGEAHTLGTCIPIADAGGFVIDYWNEKYDYTPVLLDPATRTFRFETRAISLEFDEWMAQYNESEEAGETLPRLQNYLIEDSYNLGCYMDLFDKRLVALPPAITNNYQY